MGRLGHKGKKSRNNNNIEDQGTMVVLKKGPWTPEEDQKLLSYVRQYGSGSWRSLSFKAGLKRCGKSCRLRWNNYLRPDIEIGDFTLEEERTIIQLHALLGNRWSVIATHLPKRTDSKIKNHWNSHIKKRLAKMGIDPVTHKSKLDTTQLGSNLNHMTQWEAARLEAEARLVHRPKHYYPSSTHQLHRRPPATLPYLRCLDVLKVWQGTLKSKYFTNGGLQTLDTNFFSSGSFREVPFIIPTTLIKNYEGNKGSLDGFVYPDHDANFIMGDPVVWPRGFLGGCVDLPISNAENHEAMDDECSSLANNLVMNTWQPASPMFL